MSKKKIQNGGWIMYLNKSNWMGLWDSEKTEEKSHKYWLNHMMKSVRCSNKIFAIP